jgi:hypothetical protein
MTGALKLGLNHYEVLGLTPAANGDEIARAFAKELSLLRPRPFGSLAEISIAYETLRDPIKRRAYDASLRPKAEPEPRHVPSKHREAESLSGAASALIERLTRDPLPPLAQRENPRPRPEPRPEPRVAPFVAASLRQPGSPEPRETNHARAAKSEEPHRPEAGETTAFETRTDSERARAVPDGAQDAGSPSIGWRIPALAAGALILAIGIGAWMGLEAGNDPQQEQPVRTAMRLPDKSSPTITPPSPAPAPNIVESPPERRTRKAVAGIRVARTSPEAPPDGSQEAPEQAGSFEPEELATGQVLEESASVEAATAKLPLPDAVIARTIARIGYPCGAIASTSTLEGAGAGVFKVTCTSGHAYRASPIRGRYHFRRLGGR